PPLFPYTTLFRSPHRTVGGRGLLPHHHLDAPVLAAAVLAVPGGDLRRAGLPGAVRTGAVARTCITRRATDLGLVAAVAACRLAHACRIPEPGAGDRGLRVDAHRPAAALDARALGGGHGGPARPQPSHARQSGVCGRRAVGTGGGICAPVRA